MPKIGMEPVRRRALIDAAILAIGQRGTLDVTVSDIAGRAGVSSALAHHYFGGKDDLLAATMWHLLTELQADLLRRAKNAETPRERLTAIIAGSFSVGQFSQEVVASWLAFYLAAQRSAPLRRLLRVYIHRLHSNLIATLRPMFSAPEAEKVAEGVAALIDGFYIRRALRDGLPNPMAAVSVIEDYVDAKLAVSGVAADQS